MPYYLILTQRLGLRSTRYPDTASGVALADDSEAGKSVASQESVVPTVIAACDYHNISVLTQAKAHTRHTVLSYSLSSDFPPLHEACACCLVSFSVADMNF